MNYLPDGTAIDNQDANRQSSISQFFYLIGNVMEGIDSQPRFEPGNVHDTGLLGPTASLPTDVGVGGNGDVFARGRAAQGTQAQAATAGLFGMSPLTLVVVGVVAYIVLKKFG